jgi:hypothetical protein
MKREVKPNNSNEENEPKSKESAPKKVNKTGHVTLMK